MKIYVGQVQMGVQEQSCSVPRNVCNTWRQQAAEISKLLDIFFISQMKWLWEGKIHITFLSALISTANQLQSWENVLLHTRISLYGLWLMCVFQFDMHSLVLLNNNNIYCITQGHSCPQKTHELIALKNLMQ